MSIKPSDYKSGIKTLGKHYQDRVTEVGIRSEITSNCFVWGSNDYGQFGHNSTTPRSSPIHYTGDNWNQVSFINHSSYGVKKDGTLWAMGYNQNGQLGQNNIIYYSSPVQIGSDTNWVDTSTFLYAGNADQHQLFQKQNGTYWVTGHNSHGQLGLNDTNNRSSIVQAHADRTWSSLNIGNAHAVVGIAASDQTLWGWGYNHHGNLGLPDGNYRVPRSSPTNIIPNTFWRQAGTSNNMFVGIKTDGTLWVMGYNNHGQLGLNDTVPRSSPVQVGVATDWQSLSVEGNHVAATRSRNLYTWGYNNHGQLGLNDTIPRSSPNHANWSFLNNIARRVVAIGNRTYVQVGVSSVTGLNQWYAIGHDSSNQFQLDGWRGESGSPDTRDRSRPVPMGPYFTEIILNEDNLTSLDYADYQMHFYPSQCVAINPASGYDNDSSTQGTY